MDFMTKRLGEIYMEAQMKQQSQKIEKKMYFIIVSRNGEQELEFKRLSEFEKNDMLKKYCNIKAIVSNEEIQDKIIKYNKSFQNVFDTEKSPNLN
jgi:RNase P protein component